MEKVEKLLGEILENQKKFEKRFDGIDEKFDSIDKRLDSMDERFDGIDDRLDGMDTKMEKMEVELRKQGIIQEKMKRNIELLVEGHQTILQTMDRRFEETKLELGERIEEVESAVTNLSTDLRFVEHKEYKNEKDIFNIKERLIKEDKMKY